MRLYAKVSLGIAILLAGSLLEIPIRTELRIRRARALLASEQRLAEVEKVIGPPFEVLTGLNDTSSWALDGPLPIDPAQELRVYQKEGIPYWRVLIVTSDGTTVSGYQVHRR